MSIETIYVRNADTVSDRDAEHVTVNVLDIGSLPGNWELYGRGSHGKMFLFTDKGVFERYLCYHPQSPYGWKRCLGLCHWGFVKEFGTYEGMS